MRLSVKNLGPLREAEVDLSQPLIILTGPNNTGKTWFSWCVYGLHRRRGTRPEGTLEGTVPDEIFSEQGADLLQLLLHNRERACAYIASEGQASLPPLFAAKPEIFEHTEIVVLNSVRSQEEELHETQRQFNRMTFGLVAVGVYDAGTDLVLLHFGKEGSKLVLGRWMGGDPDGDTPPLVSISQLSPEQRAQVKQGVLRALFPHFTLAQLPSCTIFPAERIAVNIFARELSLKRSELVDEMLDVEGIPGKAALQAAILNRRASRYPWPIRDSLRIADDLAANSREQSEFADLATDLETSVMGGKIGISKQGDMTFSPSQAPDKALGIHLTASVVKSLSSLVFYFRYLANAGDFLIIDEPELNLHPDNQRRVARVLAKAVNRGFKIMLSTHSDCLIREFNHLIMLSQDSDVARELRKEFEYEESSLLTPDKVGVYLFNEDRATSIPVRENGFEVKTIDDEINKMNFVTQTLYARLFD